MTSKIGSPSEQQVMQGHAIKDISIATDADHADRLLDYKKLVLSNKLYSAEANERGAHQYLLSGRIILFDGEYRDQELDINFAVNPIHDPLQNFSLPDGSNSTIDDNGTAPITELSVENVLHTFE